MLILVHSGATLQFDAEDDSVVGRGDIFGVGTGDIVGVCIGYNLGVDVSSCMLFSPKMLVFELNSFLGFFY